MWSPAVTGVTVVAVSPTLDALRPAPPGILVVMVDHRDQRQ